MKKDYLNMTNEEFEGNEAFFEENKPTPLLSWYDIFWVCLFVFFAFGFFYQCNQNDKLKAMSEVDKETIAYLKQQLEIEVKK
jgi:hypothetical protein